MDSISLGFERITKVRGVSDSNHPVFLRKDKRTDEKSFTAKANS